MVKDTMKINHDYSDKSSLNIFLDEESNINIARFLKLLKDSNEHGIGA